MPHKKTVSKKTSEPAKEASTRRSSTSKSSTTSTKKAATTKKTTTKPHRTSSSTRKYSPAAQKEVKKEMEKLKKGTAKSGRSGKPVTSRKQAIAIGLSKARKKGAKVPTKS